MTVKKVEISIEYENANSFKEPEYQIYNNEDGDICKKKIEKLFGKLRENEKTAKK